jgi:hypothetical protein
MGFSHCTRQTTLAVTTHCFLHSSERKKVRLIGGGGGARHTEGRLESTGLVGARSLPDET